MPLGKIEHIIPYFYTIGNTHMINKSYLNIIYPLEIFGNICYNVRCFDFVEQCRTIKLAIKGYYNDTTS